RHCHRLWLASLRSTGQLLRDGAAGAAVHDLGRWAQRYHPSQPAVRPIAVGAVHTAGLLYRAARRLPAREAGVDRWPRPQASTVPGALATAYAVTTIGTGLARGFVWSRDALESYFGPGPSKRVLARLVNAGLWAGATMAVYNAGVAYVGRANQKVEPGYATAPTSPLLSGCPESLLPFADLGQQGRRFVTDVVTPELIEEVMGEPAIAQPIRAYVGFNSEPLYQTGRAELALAELDRAGAFDRSYLLLISPTGTGWVDQTLIEAAEFLTRGDIATCCIQYARYPSFLSVQKVALGRRQFRLLLWGVKQRLAGLPPEGRPRVLVFGESMGAWTSSDVLMYQGIDGFDHYGIDRALWVGLPWLAKWSRSGMTRGSSTLVPHGTVEVFDRQEQLQELTEEERARLRAVVLSHDNDPIAVFGPDLLVQRPTWLANGQRGRGVPAQMRWLPVATFLQTGMDAMNAMLKVPGEFTSFGHDYRADMAGFVGDAYRLPHATAPQLAGIERTLRTLELERAERIKAEHSHTAPPAPAQRSGGARIRGGVPLHSPRTRGARWIGRRGPNGRTGAAAAGGSEAGSTA
ncbi:MAG TPA: alpha/beta-hydrolase family protein, partial [Actinomycetes bacterium]|nr:alpha/beta-hydrolase family protein [Actinomycetes bacterium]